MVSQISRHSVLMDPPSMEPNGLLSVKKTVALIDEDPVEAMAGFEKLLEAPDRLSSLDHFNALVGRAKVFLMKPIPENLESSREDIMKALEVLENPDPQMIEISWKKAEVLKYLALICIEEEKYDEALHHFKAGWEVCKGHRRLALDYIKFLEKNRKDVNGALSICDEAIANNPNSFDLLYVRAKIHAVAMNWQKAVDDCVSFLENKENNLGYRKEILDLAADISSTKLHEYVEACKHMQEGCRLEVSVPRQIARSKELLNTRWLSVMPKIAMGSDRWPAVEKSPRAALGVFEELLQSMWPPKILFDLLLGYSIASIQLGRKENYPSVRNRLERALQLFKEDPVENGPVFHWLAALCKEEGKWDEQYKWRKAAYEADRGRYFSPFIEFLPNGHEKEALELCDQALKFDPPYIRALYYRAHIYCILRKWREALKECASFLADDLTDLDERREILDMAAEACIKIGDHEAAHDYMQEAYELDTSSDLIERFKKISEIQQMLETDQTLKRKPPKEDLSHLLKAALGNTAPTEALKLFDHILLSGDRLSPSDLCEALIGRAKTCVKTKDLQNLPSARQNLNQALRLIPQNLGVAEIRKKKGEIFCCFGQINEMENSPAEALEKFQEAWTVDKTKETLIAFTDFLEGRRETRLAIDLYEDGVYSKVISKFTSLYWQARTFYRTEQWLPLIGNCETTLELGLDGRTHVELLYYVSIAYKKTGDYRRAEERALEACEFGEFENVVNYIERMKNLLEIKKAMIVNEHLRKLPVIATSGQAKLLLQTYGKEFSDHQGHYAGFLFIRAQIYSREEKFTDAQEDYIAALRIYDANPHLFPKEERARIQAEFDNHSKRHVEFLLKHGQVADYEAALAIFASKPDLFPKKEQARVQKLLTEAQPKK